jgi:hypothetical protein
MSALEDLCKARCYFCRMGDIPVLIPQSGAYVHSDNFSEGPETGSWPFTCAAADIRRGALAAPALKVLKVTVVINRGTDKIHLTLDHPTTFPHIAESGENYGCHATIEAQAGTGVDWVKKELGVEPEIIRMNGRKEVPAN